MATTGGAKGANELPGWPIYRDAIDRSLADPADLISTDWEPADVSSQKTLAMFRVAAEAELPSEINEQALVRLESSAILINFAVPLDDFLICVEDLSNVLEGDRQSRSRLTDEQLDAVRELRRRFQKEVLGRRDALKAVRNKLGAHTDRSIYPAEAAALVRCISLHVVADWLHTALFILSQLTVLDCYAWCSDGYRQGEFRLMTCEPTVLSFRADNPTELLRFEISESPKRHIHEAIADIVDQSDWMFRDGQRRLVVNRK